MPKDDRLYLGHMLDAARRVVEKTSGIDHEAFDQDEDRRSAVVHLLQTPGEAARRVSTDQRRAYPEFPRQDIVAMRHEIVHDYFRIDENIVWNVATAESPSLVSVLARLVPHEPEAK